MSVWKKALAVILPIWLLLLPLLGSSGEPMHAMEAGPPANEAGNRPGALPFVAASHGGTGRTGPATELRNPIRVGDLIITVQRVRRAEVLSRLGRAVEPEGEFVVIVATARNRGDEPASLRARDFDLDVPELDVTFDVDRDATRAVTAMAGREESVATYFGIEVPPGESEQFLLAFDVPRGVEEVTLLVEGANRGVDITNLDRARFLPTPTPTSTPVTIVTRERVRMTPTPDPYAAEEARYRRFVSETLNDYVDAFSTIDRLAREASSNPFMLVGGGFQRQAREAIAAVEAINARVTEQEAPPRYEAFQDQYVRVAEQFGEAGRLLREGIRTRDQSVIGRAEQALERASEEISALPFEDLR